MTHEFDKDKTTREDWGNIYIIYILTLKKNTLRSYCSFLKNLKVTGCSISYFGMPTKDFE